MLKRDPVRDIKFNIFNSDYFIAAYETGLIEYYDIR